MEIKFACIKSNRKAISYRGWGPRAMNCQKQSLALPDSQVDPEELNISGAITATLID
jgi:hypothetical protein